MTTSADYQLAIIHLTEISMYQQAAVLALGGCLCAADAAIRKIKMQLIRESCNNLQHELVLLQAALFDESSTQGLEVKYLELVASK